MIPAKIDSFLGSGSSLGLVGSISPPVDNLVCLNRERNYLWRWLNTDPADVLIPSGKGYDIFSRTRCLLLSTCEDALDRLHNLGEEGVPSPSLLDMFVSTHVSSCVLKFRARIF